jgi:DNA repair exonuclease SbcCD ATPase subunit
VRSHLVKIELDPLIEKLKTALIDDYSQMFTEQGRPRTKGPVASADEELAAMEVDLAAVQRKARELADSENRFQSLNEQIARLEEEAKDTKRRAEEVAKGARDAELLLNELKTHENAFKAAQKDLHAVEADIRTVGDSRKTVEELKTEISQLDRRVQQFKDQEAEFVRQHNAASQALQDERVMHGDLQTQLERKQGLLKCRRIQDELEKLEAQLKEAESLAVETSRLEEQRSKIPGLTPQKLNKLEGLGRELTELAAQIMATGITVDLTPEQAGAVEVTDSGTKRKLQIKRGDTETLTSGQALRLRLQGWGDIRVRSGAAELKELEEHSAEKQRELSAALAELGVKTVVQAASLLEQRKDLDAKIRDAQRELKRAFGEFDNIESLKLETNQRNAHLVNIRKSLHPKSTEEVLSVSELEAKEESLKAEVKHANDSIQQRIRAVNGFIESQSKCRDGRHAVETESVKLKEQQRGIEKQIADISCRYPNGMEVAQTKTQDAFTEARALVDGTRRKLPPDAEKLPERNRRAAAAAGQVQGELEKRKDERNRLHGTLEALGSEGLYSRETELLEKIEVKKSGAQAARRRGWAARLLHDLMERRKQDATRALLAPLQKSLSSAFADLTGVTSRTVFLDENLQIRGVGRSDDEGVPFEHLSQGAKEQLLLALRLAVTTALSEDEPQSLILDDVLVNTDPVRQDRVLDLLQTAARRMQILVLTCHADRYRGIGKTINIERCSR